MYPRTLNENLALKARIRRILAHDPEFFVDQTARLIEFTKKRVAAEPKEDADRLVSNFLKGLPPLALVEMEKLPALLAEHVVADELAEHVADFEPLEAFLWVSAIELFYADRRAAGQEIGGFEVYSAFLPAWQSRHA